MKLIRLSMVAFGPYKSEQIIDFTELEDRRLFVISGATGAGKTTIFDAITFALYGTASGSDRENSAMLRSHFADDDIHTSVELTFKLKNRTYRVFRQMGHVKEGNKTKTGDRYELFEVTKNGEIPAVERQMVTEINDKLESLIGLTVNQFKQIVMLPQGEFRKLLTSDTENKEAILRRLFQTERYELIEQLLSKKQLSLRQQYEYEKQELHRLTEQINSSLPERENSDLYTLLNSEYYQIAELCNELTKESNFYTEKSVKDEQIYKQSVNEYEEQQKATTYAIMINEKFQQLDEKEKQLQKLLEIQDDISTKEVRLENAERASYLIPYELQLLERQKELNKVNESLTIIHKKLESSKQAVEVARKNYHQEENRAKEREKVNTELITYENYLPIVQSINEEKTLLNKLSAQIEAKKNNKKQIKQTLIEAQLLLKRKSEKLNEYEYEVQSFTDLKIKYNELRNNYKLWERFIVASSDYKDITNKLMDQKAKIKIAEQKFAALEKQFNEQQAALLAQNLVEGNPCPVCGSTNHPNVQHDVHRIITNEERNKQWDLLQQQQNEFYKLNGTHTNIATTIEQLKQDLKIESMSIEEAKEKRRAIVEEGKQLKDLLDKLEQKLASIKKLKVENTEIEKQIEQIASEKEQLVQHIGKLELEQATRKATFTERIRKIPEEYQQLPVLEEKIVYTKSLKEKLERAWQRATDQLKQAETNLATCHVQFNNAKEQLNTVTEQVKNATESFTTHLEQANFKHIEQYRAAKLSQDERKHLKMEIENYKQQVVTLQKQLSDLRVELSDKKRTNIEAMQQRVSQLKLRYEQAFEQMNRSKEYKEAAQKLKENIYKTNEQVTQLDKQLANVKDIYDTLRGQNNKRLSFERYLLIDYLDQIIYAANSRFKHLSDGQYYLIRSDRQESHGRQSGLTIDVYDGYTGQMRDVKTLSGGEKFIASLCLALGMSDVMQSFQGNIQIETMFIDEGFGSLDEESLQKSIDTLVQLQESGRIIGVISHVEQLKRIFPARLEVKKSKDGDSSATFIIN